MRRLYSRARRNHIVDIAAFAAIVIAIIATLRFLPQPDPLRVSGRARLVDGDSLFVQGVELRLVGIDAPEAAQTCDRSGVVWPCGQEAARALSRLLRDHVLECEGNERDVHDRLLATCKVDNVVLNRWMVEQGWAVSFHGYPAEERTARAAKRGIWSGTFIRPQQWRAENR